MPTDTSVRLTSGRLLAKNTIWNLFGQLAPLVVAALVIPVLIRSIGVDRFGVLSVAWMLIGYFSLFDFGIGEGLTKMVADRLGTGEERDIPPLVWTSLAIMLALGIVSGVLLCALSPWAVEHALKIPPALQYESLRSFYVLAIGMPVVIVTPGVRGILEAMQRFAILSAIRIPMGLFSFLGPLLVLPFSRSLVPIVTVLVIGRAVGVLVHLMVCLRTMPALAKSVEFRYSLAKPVLHFGGWITVSNIVSPLMMNMDRFFIGAILSVGAVAYYSAPFDMITKLSLVSGSLVGVLFPAFAVAFVSDRHRMQLLLNRGMKFAFLTIFPVVLVVLTLAPEGLRLWLGESFALQSASVLRWLTAGVFINCLAQIAAAMIQATGRPDLTAKIHLVELPIYLGVIWALIRSHGIIGAAWAWTGRITLDSLLIFAVASRFLPDGAAELRRLAFAVAGSIAAFLLAAMFTTITAKAVFLLIVLSAFGWITWFVLLAPEERAFMLLLPSRFTLRRYSAELEPGELP